MNRDELLGRKRVVRRTIDRAGELVLTLKEVTVYLERCGDVEVAALCREFLVRLGDRREVLQREHHQLYQELLRPTEDAVEVLR